MRSADTAGGARGPRPLVPADAGTQFCPDCVKDWVPACERVRESPHPLIPAEAGIQSLRKMSSELGPRFRGDERVETPHVPSAVFFTRSIKEVFGRIDGKAPAAAAGTGAEVPTKVVLACKSDPWCSGRT